MLTIDYKSRPSSRELLSHDIFKNFKPLVVKESLYLDFKFDKEQTESYIFNFFLNEKDLDVIPVLNLNESIIPLSEVSNIPLQSEIVLSEDSLHENLRSYVLSEVSNFPLQSEIVLSEQPGRFSEVRK